MTAVSQAATPLQRQLSGHSVVPLPFRSRGGMAPAVVSLIFLLRPLQMVSSWDEVIFPAKILTGKRF